MRLISVNDLKDGMILGRTIWNEAGHPLLQKDVVITSAIMKRLQQLNMQYIYINDELSQGITIEETISTEERLKAVNNIKQSFKAVKGADSKNISYVLEQHTKSLNALVDDLLSTILYQSDIITILTDAYLYDEYVYQHSLQVTLYSLAIGKHLGYGEKDLRLIGTGAILHDVGKMLIPEKILQKEGPLTTAEYDEIKKHTTYGFDILRNLHTVSLLVAHCAFQHHERLDGSGYPRAIKGIEIHPYAKIIGVADVFDAMTSNRVYRQKMFPSKVLQIMEEGKDSLYDAMIVDALKATVVHYPNGSMVMLQDGQKGIVSKQNSNMPERPFVRIFEKNGKILPATYELDLSKHLQLQFEQVTDKLHSLNES